MKYLIIIIGMVVTISSGYVIAEKKVTQTGATTSKQFEYSGFLSAYKGGYDDFKVINETTGAKVWIKPPYQDLSILKDYRKIMLSSVEVWLHSESDYKGADPDLFKEMTDYFENSLKETLSDKFELVDARGTGVMNLRIAITGVNMTRAITKTHFTAQASVEMEVLDSDSGKRLVAAIDRHSKWKRKQGEGAEPYKKILDHWSQVISNRLSSARSL